MANTKSAAKRARQTITKTVQNKHVLTGLKRQLKKLRASSGDEFKKLLPGTVSTLDRAAKSGRIHRNAANRLKSRLNKKSAAAAA